MKKLLRPTTFALLTMALCFTACENGNNSYPKEYLGFEKKAQDFSYQKNAEETEECRGNGTASKNRCG